MRLDEAAEVFRSHPLDAGPYTFVAADTLVLKVRENGRVVRTFSLVDSDTKVDVNTGIVPTGRLQSLTGSVQGLRHRYRRVESPAGQDK